MRCEDVQAHLPDRLAGALPAATAEEVSAHLRSCAACTAEVEAIEDTWRRLRTIPAPAADSETLRARFEDVLEAYRQPSGTPGRLARYGLWFSAAAALLLVGVAIGRQTAPAPAGDSQIAGLRAELGEMRVMVALSLLQQQSASERLKGVTYTSQIDQPGSEITAALLDALMHDPNPNVRLRTVDALKRFADQEAVRRGAIEALPRQTSPLVQIALIDFVVEMDGGEAADVLRGVANDPMLDEEVRARAAAGLRQLG